MKATTKTLVGTHPKHGKSNGQRVLPRIRVFTVPTVEPHTVISTGDDYPCGNFLARCEGRTLREGGRCPKCLGQKLPPVQHISADGTPKDVLSAGRVDTPELRDLRRREVADMKAVQRAARDVGRKERQRVKAARKAA